MRTDTERLDFLLQAMETQDEAAAERVQGALMLGLKGRAALDAAMGAKLIEPGEPMPELTAIDLATAEVGRIRNVKGFSEERDDLYIDGELADAAACYLIRDAGAYWPENWDRRGWKPSPDDRKKELTKGIALALCELDRLIRAERRASLEMQAEVAREMAERACEPESEPRAFKAGDKVRVVRRALWGGWMDEMDALIGREFALTEDAAADGESPILAFIENRWVPIESLEHVDG